jgi:hypothetical protein
LHEALQGDVEAEDRVGAAVGGVLKEAEGRDLLLVVDVLVGAAGADHVVEALKGVARDLWPRLHDLEVVLEAALPVQVPVLVVVLQRGDPLDHRRRSTRGKALRNVRHFEGLDWGHATPCSPDTRARPLLLTE